VNQTGDEVRMASTEYGIWCEIALIGNKTSSLEAWLHDLRDDSKIWVFDNETDAAVMASHYQKSVTAYWTARYKVRPIPTET
jgi:hypothetical protein